jgi:hypothetical protein
MAELEKAIYIKSQASVIAAAPNNLLNLCDQRLENP